jgi:hypothetical protein
MLRVKRDPDFDAKMRKALEGKTHEVEIELIRRTVQGHGNYDAELLALKYGQTFAGIRRPKGYRQMAKKQCFCNAQSLAEMDRGTYCEGFVLSPGSGPAFLHAWITLDGRSAIDVTLPGAEECKYFGIPFGEPSLKELMIKISIKENKEWTSMLSPPVDKRVIATLQTLKAEGHI